MLTKLQAVEWAPYGIRANAITPGYIRTPGTEAMYADPEIYEGRRKGVPMGRVGSGEDITGVAVFLACEESAIHHRQRARRRRRPGCRLFPFGAWAAVLGGRMD